MIVCPNCNHQNPEGANQCEACYTPLPSTTSCPNCGASVQTDATFCGQCGFNLQVQMSSSPDSFPEIPETIVNPPEIAEAEVPAVVEPVSSPTIQSMPNVMEELEETITIPPIGSNIPESEEEVASSPVVSNIPESEEEVVSSPVVSNIPESEEEVASSPVVSNVSESEEEVASSPVVSNVSESEESQTLIPTTPIVSGGGSATQLQIQTAKLFHVQTSTSMELPQNLSVIHIGKPNDQIPPDIDVSGFPNSDIVSRVHSDIRVEGDIYYLEDVGSSNGTYVNHTPLLVGNRHRLRTGDRISLGKGDKMTFIFQIS